MILDEIRRLETELYRQENLYDTLFEEKRAVCTELEMLTRLSSQQKEKESRQTDKIKQLQRELESNEEIVSCKNYLMMLLHLLLMKMVMMMMIDLDDEVLIMTMFLVMKIVMVISMVM